MPVRRLYVRRRRFGARRAAGAASRGFKRRRTSSVSSFFSGNAILAHEPKHRWRVHRPQVVGWGVARPSGAAGGRTRGARRPLKRARGAGRGGAVGGRAAWERVNHGFNPFNQSPLDQERAASLAFRQGLDLARSTARDYKHPGLLPGIGAALAAAALPAAYGAVDLGMAIANDVPELIAAGLGHLAPNLLRPPPARGPYPVAPLHLDHEAWGAYMRGLRPRA